MSYYICHNITEAKIDAKAICDVINQFYLVKKKKRKRKEKKKKKNKKIF